MGIGLLLMTFLAGLWVMNRWLKPKQAKPVEQATVLVEKIRKVAKLIAVEGYFVEHYDYGDPHPGPYFIGPIPNLQAFLPRKEAHVRIKARVAIGYDLENMKIEAYPEQKLIRLSQLPAPEILSIDSEIDLFDDQSSIFRPLTEEDHIRIYRGAREKIKEAALNSQLLSAAREQGNEMIDIMRFMAEQAGWQLLLDSLPTPADKSALEQMLPPDTSERLWEGENY